MSASHETTPLLSRNGRHSRTRLTDVLSAGDAWPAMLLQCILTGIFDSITFATMRTWVGFMTGNLTQIALAFIDTLSGEVLEIGGTTRLQRSSASLAGFCVGAYGVALTLRQLRTRRDGATDTSRGQSRGWYIFISLAHIICVIVHLLVVTVFPSSPSSSLGLLSLGLLSMPMGSQAVLSLSVGSPNPYSTTVVFTSSLASLFSDGQFPQGLVPGSSSSKKSALRHRAASLVALVGGGLLGGALIVAERKLGSTRKGVGQRGGGSNDQEDISPDMLPTTWAWIVVVLLQLSIVYAWWAVPAKPANEDEHEDDQA